MQNQPHFCSLGKWTNGKIKIKREQANGRTTLENEGCHVIKFTLSRPTRK